MLPVLHLPMKQESCVSGVAVPARHGSRLNDRYQQSSTRKTCSQPGTVVSAPRSMVGKIAKAFSGRGGAATAAVADDWQKF